MSRYPLAGLKLLYQCPEEVLRQAGRCRTRRNGSRTSLRRVPNIAAACHPGARSPTFARSYMLYQLNLLTRLLKPRLERNRKKIRVAVSSATAGREVCGFPNFSCPARMYEICRNTGHDLLVGARILVGVAAGRGAIGRGAFPTTDLLVRGPRKENFRVLYSP